MKTSGFLNRQIHTVTPAASSAASKKTLELLRPEVQLQAQRFGVGYLDVVGEQDPLGFHVSQRVFRSRAFALIYERLWRPSTARLFFGGRLWAIEERRMTMSMLGVSWGDRVLDVGCGPGNYTRHLADAVGDGLAVGIDASAPLLTRAAKRAGGSNLAYVRGDASALPFEDGSFNAVCCIGVLHLIEDPMTGLDEMVRILIPGGRMVVVATCGSDTSIRSLGGVTVFKHDELTNALAERGLVDIEQRVVRRGQFVAASMRTG